MRMCDEAAVRAASGSPLSMAATMAACSRCRRGIRSAKGETGEDELMKKSARSYMAAPKLSTIGVPDMP